jgi:hypothetical protein
MKSKRLIAGIVMTVLLVLLLLYSGLEYNNNDPTIEYILDNVEQFNNTLISFSGTIENINTTNQQIIVSFPTTSETVKVTLTSLPDTIIKGNHVEILGILDDNYHVSAEKIIIRERWKSDLIIIRSLPAIPFVLYLFFRKWQFNKKTCRFEPRDTNA